MNYNRLTTYGFERSRADDFSDDGTYFHCYRLENLLIRYARDDGYVYLAADYMAKQDDVVKLTWGEYSILPHYRDATDSLNGVPEAELTDAALKKFHDDCLAYLHEYEEAVKKLKYPEESEIFDALQKIRAVRDFEYYQVRNELRENAQKILLLPISTLLQLKRHYETLDREFKARASLSNVERSHAMKGTFESRMLLKNLHSKLTPSFSYSQAIEVINQAKNS